MVTKSETRVPDVACTIDAEAARPFLEFTFSDGGEPIIMSLAVLSNDMLTYAALHGLKQRIGDAAAIPRNTDTGRSATVAEKRAAMEKVRDTILQGEWSARREGGGNEGGLLLRALGRLYPAKSREDLAAWVANKSKAEQAAMRANPRVAAIIAELRAESAKGIDTDGLLGELDD